MKNLKNLTQKCQRWMLFLSIALIGNSNHFVAMEQKTEKTKNKTPLEKMYKNMGDFTKLPDEITLHILLFLKHSDRLKFGKTCNYAYNIYKQANEIEHIEKQNESDNIQKLYIPASKIAAVYLFNTTDCINKKMDVNVKIITTALEKIGCFTHSNEFVELQENTDNLTPLIEKFSNIIKRLFIKKKYECIFFFFHPWNVNDSLFYYKIPSLINLIAQQQKLHPYGKPIVFFHTFPRGEGYNTRHVIPDTPDHFHISNTYPSISITIKNNNEQNDTLKNVFREIFSPKNCTSLKNVMFDLHKNNIITVENSKNHSLKKLCQVPFKNPVIYLACSPENEAVYAQILKELGIKFQLPPYQLRINSLDDGTDLQGSLSKEELNVEKSLNNKSLFRMYKLATERNNDFIIIIGDDTSSFEKHNYLLEKSLVEQNQLFSVSKTNIPSIIYITIDNSSKKNDSRQPFINLLTINSCLPNKKSFKHKVLGSYFITEIANILGDTQQQQISLDEMFKELSRSLPLLVRVTPSTHELANQIPELEQHGVACKQEIIIVKNK